MDEMIAVAFGAMARERTSVSSKGRDPRLRAPRYIGAVALTGCPDTRGPLIWFKFDFDQF